MTTLKTLLVTSSTPGDRHVGEIILRDLCAFLSPEKLCIFSAGDLAPQESRYPTRSHSPPAEQAWRPFSGRLGGLLNYGRVRTRFSKQIDALADSAVDYGREQGVEQVWQVLNSVSIIATGAKIAQKLGVPLRTLVWDPFEYLCRQKGWDAYSRTWLKKRFAQALGSSEKLMVVSDGMVKQYGAKYGAKCVIVRHALRQQPESADEPNGSAEGRPLRIGFAGTLYDHPQLNVLLTALNSLGWEIAGKRVVIRVIAKDITFRRMDYPCNIELLGWRSTDETLRLLKECAVQYLPVSFSDYWKEFAQLSFPTKLSTYLATGRPVLVHGPADCSSSLFCEQTKIGICCNSLDVGAMSMALLKLLGDSALYAVTSQSVVRTCREFFTPAMMESQFRKFMDLEEQ